MHEHSHTEASVLPRILFVEQLSQIIGKTATTIRTCATNEKYKHLIPRPFKMPNSRRLAWYEHDVLTWLSGSQVVKPSSKPHRGPPTKIERVAANAAGLGVKEWRQHQKSPVVQGRP